METFLISIGVVYLIFLAAEVVADRAYEKANVKISAQNRARFYNGRQ